MSKSIVEEIKDIKKFINFCRECKNFEHESDEKMYIELAQELEHVLDKFEELGKINFRLLNNGVPKEAFDELRLKLKKEKNENEANKKRIEELEKENKMFKEFYRACGSTDIAENITATRYAEIRRQGYMEGVAERDKLAKEICKEC